MCFYTFFFSFCLFFFCFFCFCLFVFCFLFLFLKKHTVQPLYNSHIHCCRGFRQKSINQFHNGKQCRSWWDGLFQAVSSGSVLFVKVHVSVLVCMDGRVYNMSIIVGHFVCLFDLFDLGLMSLSTIFQSNRDGVWMWQGAQCSPLECCLTEISRPRHFDMIFHPVTLYWHWADQFYLYFLNAERRAWQIYCQAARNKSKSWLGKWFFISRPEKCIEYIRNILIPSYFQDAVDCGASGWNLNLSGPVSAKAKERLVPFLKSLVWPGRGSNPQLPGHKADALPLSHCDGGSFCTASHRK